MKFSVPGPGRTIQSSILVWTKPLESALKLLIESAKTKQVEDEIINRYTLTFSPVIPIGGKSNFSKDDSVKLAASAILCIWMLAKMVYPEKLLSFYEAEQWFLGSSKQRVPGIISEAWLSTSDESLKILADLSYDDKFRDLFPYILEIFEVYSSSNTALNSKQTKRSQGFFPTPSDIAEYIAEYTLEGLFDISNQDTLNLQGFNCLDIACGTGVFPLALLDTLKKISQKKSASFSYLNTAMACIYGLDISWQAIQSCTFALLSRCLDEILEKEISFWQAWHALRGNFAVMDSTLVVGRGISETTQKNQERLAVRNELLKSNFNHLIPDKHQVEKQVLTSNYWSLGGLLEHEFSPQLLGDLFGECASGFSVIIGNPPYTQIPRDSWRSLRASFFSTVPTENSAKSSNIFTLFVEMMWQLSNPQFARAGMVIPLSIAYHSDRYFQLLRSLIEKTEASWRFSFFDRTPDSLFGDDVKTRNAIVLMERKQGSKTTISTSPLTRWNSRNRSRLFLALKHTNIDGLSIKDFIPKIGESLELETYKVLRTKSKRLGFLWQNSFSINSESNTNNSKYVFYCSTAYNWLPVFRHLPVIDNSNNASFSTSLRGLNCDTTENANFVFTVASSRLAYWLWRVEQDGFHLNQSFLSNLPIHPSYFTVESLKNLSTLAGELWEELLQHPVESVNSGRKTINFSPRNCDKIIDEIDIILAKSLGISEQFLDFLRLFISETIVAGRSDEFRRKTN